MKKTLGWLIALMMALQMSAVALGETTVTNPAYNETKMQTVSGDTVTLEGNELIYGAPYLGFAFEEPAGWQKNGEIGLLETGSNEDTEFSLFYIPQAYAQKLNESQGLSTEAWNALLDDADAHTISIFSIFRMNQTPELSELGAQQKAAFQKAELIGTMGEEQYWIAWNEDFGNAVLSAEDQQRVNALIDSVKELRKSLIIFPAVPDEEIRSQLEQEQTPSDLPSFSVTDLNGETVTEAVLAKYDLTMINVWATGCGICIEEMPTLQKLKESLPANVNLLTICEDAADNLDLVKEIVAKSTYQTLIPDADLKAFLEQNVSAWPTTLFVDSTGHVVGQAVLGVPNPTAAFGGYDEIIAANLASLGK